MLTREYLYMFYIVQNKKSKKEDEKDEEEKFDYIGV